MAKSGSRSSAGGGPKSRQVTERPVRTGTPSRGVSPRGVSQIGSSMGNHAMGRAGPNPLSRSRTYVRRPAPHCCGRTAWK